MARDLYQEITDKIIEQMEQGIIPWRKPWTGVRSGAISHATGRAYSIINQMLLGEPGEYLTFNQCKAEGGKIRKGENGKVVVFWKMQGYALTDEDGQPIIGDDGTPEVKTVPFLRHYVVFHVDQCEGIEPRWEMTDQGAQPDEQAEQLFRDYVDREGIRVESVAGDQASYSPVLDRIKLPLLEQFGDTGEYYSTAFHEGVHSTGHKSRLARFEDSAGAAFFGSESYSKEELVAEIGSAMLMHEIGMETPGTFKNSVAYLQSWLRELRNDKKLIISAAGKAQKAVEMILNI